MTGYDNKTISQRDKQILAGLYLAKFDTKGLRRLGFDSFIEAFNVLGFALGGRPARVKNYRDEFDPLFPNARKGWHKRERRPYCMEVFESFGHLDLEAFASLIQSFFGIDPALLPEQITKKGERETARAFTSRLVTGVAAEKYFRTVHPSLPQLSEYQLEDMTLAGCGYDFRLNPQRGSDFLAVEVKGLKDERGSVSLTAKEHQIATTLEDRFLLFVVKNFRVKPFHEIYRNPFTGPLQFVRKEQVVVQLAWTAKV